MRVLWELYQKRNETELSTHAFILYGKMALSPISSATKMFVAKMYILKMLTGKYLEPWR